MSYNYTMIVALVYFFENKYNNMSEFSFFSTKIIQKSLLLFEKLYDSNDFFIQRKINKFFFVHLKHLDSSKEYTDTFIGSSSSVNYFVVYSKYFFYVYNKKGQLIKAEKLPFPILQIEVIENQTIQDFGIELEIIARTEDCRDNEDKERDYMSIEYMFILDPSRVPISKIKKNLIVING
jgi:hypothetical protein